MNEEDLYEFKASAPPPGLKGRILAGARTAPRPGLVDRLWTRRTWMSLAAAFLGAVALYAYSVSSLRLDPAGSFAEVRRAIAAGRDVVKRERQEGVLTVLEARLKFEESGTLQ